MLKCCSYLLLFLLMFGCSLHGLSQNSLLWKVTSPKTHYDNYLYGTMHLQDYRVFQFGDSVLPAFKSCKVLATEILMDQAGIDLLKFMFVSDSTHAIKYHLQLHEYEFLKQYAQNHLGPVSAMIDQMHPFFIYSLIINQRTRHDKSKALDMILQELAVAEGLENMAIETIEEQMGAINKVSIEEQMDALKEIYGGLTEIDSLLELMLNQYAEQNLDGLMQTATQTGMSESVNKYLLTDRNMRMARRLDSMFLKKATFAAFGAAHLPGDSGVIELLKGRGYSIQQVSSTESVSWDIPIGFPAAWRALDHKSADFEIEFPATPDASTETLQTGDYEIDQQIYSCTFEAHQSTPSVNAIARSEPHIFGAPTAR